MSIVASVKVYDGIVIGAESMTQLFANVPGNPQPVCIKAYSHARKIFQVGKLGVLTFGGGNIGNRSIESFVDEFGDQEKALPDDTDRSVQGVTGRLLTFMRGHYNGGFEAVPEAQRPQIGFYVAGYSPGQPLGSEWEFMLPTAQQPTQARPDGAMGASWRGIQIPFTRLFFGVDPRIEQILTQVGMNQAQIGAFRDSVNTQLRSSVAFDGMPLQDALGFCRFIIEVTIGLSTYEMGVPTCGGRINIAVITHSAGFQWISEPRLNFGRRRTDVD
ncbi:MAG: hypothetical protein ABSE45_10445 [Candidatus Acidiferrales bacterium]|jgi:hypothetical protein